MAFGLAFVAGSAVGAIAGLALAPGSGAETRRAVADGKETFVQSALFIWDVAREKAMATRFAGATALDRLVCSLEAGIDEARRVQSETKKKRDFHS